MEIGSLLGKAVQVDLDDDLEQGWSCLLRVKVQINVLAPLKRGIFLKFGSKKEDKWISIT